MPVSALTPCWSFPCPSGQVNFLLWRYLQESGFTHSAYTFQNEAQLNKTPTWSEWNKQVGHHKCPPHGTPLHVTPNDLVLAIDANRG
jgi:hypothetical protein